MHFFNLCNYIADRLKGGDYVMIRVFIQSFDSFREKLQYQYKIQNNNNIKTLWLGF